MKKNPFISSRGILFLVLLLLLIPIVTFIPPEDPIIEKGSDPFNRFSLQDASKQVQIAIAADSDDDYWRYQDNSWTHVTDKNEVSIRNRQSVGVEYGQCRWSLPIPKNSRIHSAELFIYELSGTYAEVRIYRINETNVGRLEADSSIPSIDGSTFSTIYYENNPMWLSGSITDLVQNQVNLADWSSGNYFGVQINLSYQYEISIEFEDIQAGGGHEAYLNITYTESVRWLDGWNYRKSYLLDQKLSSGVNYSIPVTIYSGDGSDHEKFVYTNNKAQLDFDDIRFTASDGETLLNYWLQNSHSEETTNQYTANVSVDLASYTKNYPAAYYYNNRTYIVFQGDLDLSGHDLDAHITYYDHENDTWSGIYYVGPNYSTLKEEQDNHGPPALWVDNSGYIHVVYGSHNTPLKHTKSKNPEDITSFIDQLYITNTRATYPTIGYDSANDIVYIVYRRQDAVDSPIVYRNSTNNGQTWSDEQVIMDLNNYYAYFGIGELDPNNNELFHLAWEMENRITFDDRDIHYVSLNITSGILYNASGYNLGTSLSNSEIFTSCLVFDTGNNIAETPDVHVDSNSYPYIIYTQARSGVGSWTAFIYWNGSAWSDSVNITENTNDIIYMGTDFIIYDSTNITAFLSEDRDMSRYTWDGNSWIFQEKIAYGVGNYALTFSTVPAGGNHDELQVIFSEYREEQKVHILAYAWGVNGLVQRNISRHAEFWVQIPGNQANNPQIIYLYYGNSVVSSISAEMTTDNPVYGIWGPEESYTTALIQEVLFSNYLSGASHIYAGKPFTITTNHTNSLGQNNVDFAFLSLLSTNSIILVANTHDENSGLATIEMGSTYIDSAFWERSSINNGWELIWTITMKWNWDRDLDYDIATKTNDTTGGESNWKNYEAGTTYYEKDLEITSLTVFINDSEEFGGSDGMIEDNDWFIGGQEVSILGMVKYSNSTIISPINFDSNYASEVYVELHYNDVATGEMDPIIENGIFSEITYTPNSFEEMYEIISFEVKIKNIPDDGSDKTTPDMKVEALVISISNNSTTQTSNDFVTNSSSSSITGTESENNDALLLLIINNGLLGGLLGGIYVFKRRNSQLNKDKSNLKEYFDKESTNNYDSTNLMTLFEEPEIQTQADELEQKLTKMREKTKQ
ncbi:MAG: BNR-4 repeat-containing protein [Candidatus Hodarchaeota archaeon]